MYEEKEFENKWWWRRGEDDEWKEFTSQEYIKKIHELSREIRRLRRVIENIGDAKM